MLNTVHNTSACITVAAALAALAPVAAGAESSIERGAIVSPEREPIKLFNGKSLEGLYTWLHDTKYEDKRGVFQVANGVLCISGDGMGAVVTQQAYQNYHLVLEYRWGGRTWRERKEAARDSGLLIHSTGAEGGYNGIWMPSLEVQIIEGGVGDFIVVGGPDDNGKPVPLSLTCEIEPVDNDEVRWRQGASRVTYRTPNCPRINWYGRDPQWKDARGFRGSEDPDSPGRAWTRLDVICRGGHVQTFVNGVKVNEAFDVSPSAGKLQLQSELAEIHLRRWELWPLDAAPPPAPADN